MPFPFKDKELNKIAAFFNLCTFLLTCAAIIQSSWFRIKGLHCTQRLSLAQFFSFDDEDDVDDQITIRQNQYDPMSMSDYNRKCARNDNMIKYVLLSLSVLQTKMQCRLAPCSIKTITLSWLQEVGGCKIILCSIIQGNPMPSSGLLAADDINEFIMASSLEVKGV